MASGNAQIIHRLVCCPKTARFSLKRSRFVRHFGVQEAFAPTGGERGVVQQGEVYTNLSLSTIAPTPICVNELEKELSSYNSPDAAVILDGFQHGFRIHYEGPHEPSDSRNIKSANQHPEIVLQKIQKELRMGRIAGPFDQRPLANLRVSPIGIVPKKEPNEFRLIHHLSHPLGSSVNDYIDKKNSSVQYTSFDEAVYMVQELGRNCLLFKIDIRSAFRLLPLAVSEFDQLGFKFQGQYYIEKCMPFGCSASCKNWELFATFLEFLVRTKAGSKYLLHYLDDFLGGGKSGTTDCLKLMQVFQQCMRQLHVPIADEKTAGPATIICFLGLELDSEKMEVRIPLHKIQEIIDRIDNFLQREKVTLREMQSLIGVLNFACRAVVPGRPFCRRLINAICGLKKPFHHLRLNKGIRQDLCMWKQFFKNFNGIAVFHDRFWVSNDHVQLFTDSAAGEGLGFGIYFAGEWACAPWPHNWFAAGHTADITVLELFPILVALYIWGERLRNKKICFRSDNLAVCHILNSMTSRSDRVMVLVRNITLKCLEMNIAIRGQHISGISNSLCDSLSRFDQGKFRQLAPEAAEEPAAIPDHLWRIFDQELLPF